MYKLNYTHHILSIIILSIKYDLSLMPQTFSISGKNKYSQVITILLFIFDISTLYVYSLHYICTKLYYYILQTVFLYTLRIDSLTYYSLQTRCTKIQLWSLKMSVYMHCYILYITLHCIKLC